MQKIRHCAMCTAQFLLAEMHRITVESWDTKTGQKLMKKTTRYYCHFCYEHTQLFFTPSSHVAR